MPNCPFCPDGHRPPGSKPMTIWVGPERDCDGQPTTIHVAYAAGHHVSEHEAIWLRNMIAFKRNRAEEFDPPLGGWPVDRG